LWRQELLPAKYSIEAVIVLGLLRRMLEWHIETEHEWSLRPGALGRGLRNDLDSKTWNELTAIFVGSGIEENWEALFRAMRLFRRTAIDVAERLALDYPNDLDARVTAYIASVPATPRDLD
jgi:aminoglycoside 6-adenylyltransferase